MKSRIIPYSLLALFAFACESGPDGSSDWQDPKFIRLEAETEILSVEGAEPFEIKWVENASMTVFNNKGGKQDLLTNEPAKNVFFSYDWEEGTDPTYAVYPAASDLTCTQEGVIGLEIAAEQKCTKAGVVENFVAVGKVSGNHTGYKIKPMTNLTGYVVVKAGFSGITSIVVEAVGGEEIAGKIAVDYKSLAEGNSTWYSVSEETTKTSVSLTPAKTDGVLNAGTYYIAVLPRSYSAGLKVTLNYQYGTPVVKTIYPEGVVVPRSALVSAGEKAIDGESLPDELRVDLSFEKGNWPFVETIVSKETQEASNYAGATYSYPCTYTSDEQEITRYLPFFIKGNGYSYYMSDWGLNMGSKNMSRITIPGLPGMYIKAIRLTSNNSAPKGCKLTDMSWTDLVVCPQKADKENHATLSFPTEDGIRTGYEASYYMYFTDKGWVTPGISILYSKELPASYDDNPFGDKQDSEPEPEPEVDKLPEEIEITLDFAAGWSLNETCVPADVQTENGESYTYTYSYQYQEESLTSDLTFIIWKGGLGTPATNKYEYKNNALEFYTEHQDNSTAMIAFPVIQDRYLKQVKAVHDGPVKVVNDVEYPSRFNLTKGFGTKTSGDHTESRYPIGVPTVFDLPVKNTDGTVKISSDLNQQYSLRMRDINMRVTKVVITYSKTKPE